MVEGGAKGETEKETSGNAERQRVGAEGGERERNGRAAESDRQ